jgi:hypothetical protein
VLSLGDILSQAPSHHHRGEQVVLRDNFIAFVEAPSDQPQRLLLVLARRVTTPPLAACSSSVRGTSFDAGCWGFANSSLVQHVGGVHQCFAAPCVWQVVCACVAHVTQGSFLHSGPVRHHML